MKNNGCQADLIRLKFITGQIYTGTVEGYLISTCENLEFSQHQQESTREFPNVVWPSHLLKFLNSKIFINNYCIACHS